MAGGAAEDRGGVDQAVCAEKIGSLKVPVLVRHTSLVDCLEEQLSMMPARSSLLPGCEPSSGR